MKQLMLNICSNDMPFFKKNAGNTVPCMITVESQKNTNERGHIQKNSIIG